MRESNENIENALHRSSLELKRLARLYEQRGLKQEAREINATASRIENRLENDKDSEGQNNKAAG